MTTPTEVRPCRHCGIADPAVMVRRSDHPTGLATICRPCQAEASGRWRAANPTASVEAQRRWRDATPSAGAERHRRDRAALGTRTDAEVLAHRDRLRPDGLKKCRACREYLPCDAFHRNRCRADGLEVTCRSCSILREADRHRRTAVAGWQALGLDPAWCVYCGAEAEHADHVWPRHLDGPDDRSNLVPACSGCNLSKNATPLVWWLPRRFPTTWPEILERLFAVDGLDVVSPATRLDLAA